MDDGQARCVCGGWVVVTHPPAHAEIESAYFNHQRNVPCPRRVPTVSDPCLLEVYARHERERHGLYVVKEAMRCGTGLGERRRWCSGGVFPGENCLKH